MQTAFRSVEEYLQSLETEITVGRLRPKRIRRASPSCFQRSNQFNLTTQRRSEAECEELMHNQDCYPLYAELKDRLGNHGLISIVVASPRGEELFLSDWLMSCRVLTRGVEQFLMNHCVEYAARYGLKWLVAEYRPTAKNGMVKNFYRSSASSLAGRERRQHRWRLDVARYQPAVTLCATEASLKRLRPLIARDTDGRQSIAVAHHGHLQGRIRRSRSGDFGP